MGRWLKMGLDEFSFLARDLPGFRLRGSQVRVILEPKDFYQVGQSNQLEEYRYPVI